jgi:hypothetical protein
MLGPIDVARLILRGFYQLKTATADFMVMPPSGLRRILQQHGTLATIIVREAGVTKGFSCSPCLAASAISHGLAGFKALGPAEAYFIEIQIGKFRADVMKDTCDGSADPSVEPFN